MSGASPRSLGSGTFRDPSGSVQICSDGAYRTIVPAFAQDTLALLRAPVYASLVKKDWVVPTEIMQGEASTEPLVLRHPLISFRSYCWEWSPALWLSAAELTLDLCTELLKDGWILKDATPHNILFKGVRPVFVDVTSIQRLDTKTPLWFAYGQFIRMFLLPMIAYKNLGWPLQNSSMRRDGLEPEEIYPFLSWPRKLLRPALTSVTIPAFFSGGGKGLASHVSSRTVDDPELTQEIISKTLSSLRRDMQRAGPDQGTSRWSDYVRTASHYNREDNAAKRSFVSEVLSRCSPVRVLDIGCNTGVYSTLAADRGAEVVSIDTDLETIERLCHGAKTGNKNILPLCVDLAHPTPRTGWENSETASFLDRCLGHFDTVLMLAVIHHLLITSQIPLGQIASLCARLTTRNLIIEWVPPLDPKYLELLRGREAIYRHITEEAFRNSFAEHFKIAAEIILENKRVLFHLIKR